MCSEQHLNVCKTWTEIETDSFQILMIAFPHFFSLIDLHHPLESLFLLIAYLLFDLWLTWDSTMLQVVVGRDEIKRRREFITFNSFLDAIKLFLIFSEKRTSIFFMMRPSSLWIHVRNWLLWCLSRTCRVTEWEGSFFIVFYDHL